MFIDEWFEKKYYKELPLGYRAQSSHQCGQFFWTHMLFTFENLINPPCGASSGN